MKDEYKEMVCRVRFIDGVPAETYLSDIEIVRCKDCIYYRQEIDMCDEPCSTAHNIVHEDDYCSRAERKEE